jgi:Na+/H+ antiporter NhaD/arsenite permease-like protein
MFIKIFTPVNYEKLRMNPKIISLAVFIAAYLLFMLFLKKRTIVAAGASLLLVLLGALSFKQAFFAVNWNVMGIFVGTLFLTDIFMESRVPAFLAEHIVNRTPSIAWAIIAICALAGFISAFVENVATVLIVAPIALALAKRLKISPVNMLIAIAISSNLQGTATLIGDPPSMLLGGYAKMNFFDFFFYRGKPSIFFAVELGALASLPVLYHVFRKHIQKTVLVAEEKVLSWIPTIMLTAMIVALALSSFFDTGFSFLAGIICMAFGLAALLWDVLWKKAPAWKKIKSLDWDTTLFLMAVFVLVGGLIANGWIETISGFLARLVGGNIFLGFFALVFLSVAISAFVDNVPYLAAMLPVAISLSKSLNLEPSLLLFGLLIGASLGGNITPIGASANIVACGILKKEGYHVSFGEFVKVGLPFTLAAVAAASVFVWFVWR